MSKSTYLFENSESNEWVHEAIDQIISVIEPIKAILASITEYYVSNFEKVKATADFIARNFSSLIPQISFDITYNQASAKQDFEQNLADEICCVSNKNLDYDAFISYSSVDYMHTDKLDLKLRQQNFRTFYAKKSIAWGDFFNQDIKRALKGSTCAIFFITPNFFHSKYARKELKLFFRLSHRNRNHNIFIVLYNVTQEDFNRNFPFAKYIQSKNYTGDMDSMISDFVKIFIERFGNETNEVDQ